MKTIGIIAMVVTAAALSGCTGLEIGGKAWITRVDERQESQRTHRENAVPLKCYLWENCNKQTNEVQGS
jgi:hypothetical protein